ncbi:MAG: hypothetical protein EA376_06480 [Phycisphaeraceae bacterium]|nr:MAG: hypothetical protein EA376_06480 [Phycisphaeraceae bacterium]
MFAAGQTEDETHAPPASTPVVLRIRWRVKVLPSPPVWAWVILGLVFIKVFYFAWTDTLWRSDVYSIIGLGSIIVLCELLSWQTRRPAHRRIEQLERTARATNDAATIAIIERARGAMMRSDRTLDPVSWRARFERLGADPPAVVLFENVRPTGAPASAAGEEIDLGAARPMGPQEVRFWVCLNLIAASACAVLTALALLSGELIVEALMLWFILPFMLAIPVARTLARRGLSPIQLSAALCAPGRMEFVRAGRSRIFAPADSTLVIEPVMHPVGPIGFAAGAAWRLAGRAAPILHRAARAWARRGWLGRWRRLEQAVGLRRFRRPITATFIRDDGMRARLTFMSGREDPGLAELWARWVEPADAQRR